MSSSSSSLSLVFLFFFFFINVFSSSGHTYDLILSKTLIGVENRVYACSENNFFAFEPNGSIAWSVHMGFKCDTSYSPVYFSVNQILVLAENRILRITFPTEVTKSESEVFFYKSEPILGFAVSVFSFSAYITVKEHGLHCYNMRKEPLWIAKPDTELFSYKLGCRANCSFDSKPVIDSCETSIYISNNQGELYSLSLDGSYYKWIRDLSFVDRLFTVKPGNNGLVYVVFPTKSLLSALDSYSSDILWQKTVGPLSASGLEPVIDVNGWISIGSLDGSLYSFSRTGELRKTPEYAEPDSPIHVAPLLDCSANAVYFAKTLLQVETNKFLGNKSTNVYAKKPKTAVLSLVVPKTRSIYWSHSYSDQNQSLSLDTDLQLFVIDESIVLAFVAASNSGNPFQCTTKCERLSRTCSIVEPEKLDGDKDYIARERGITWFIMLGFVFIVLLGAFRKIKKLLCPLIAFSDKLSWLHRERREPTFHDIELGDVEKELYATYNLGRDIDVPKPKDKYFKAPSGNDESSSEDKEHQHCVLDLNRKLKGKRIIYSDDEEESNFYDIELGDAKKELRATYNLGRDMDVPKPKEFDLKRLSYGDEDKESAAYFKAPSGDEESSSKDKEHQHQHQHGVVDLNRKLKAKRIVSRIRKHKEAMRCHAQKIRSTNTNIV
ncbi:unnamed protein product [Cochlearia groenlandica]